MSARQYFENSWASRFADKSPNVTAPPGLECWTSNGELKSEEAMRQELAQCRQRIAELRRRIEDELFLETFCQQQLANLEPRRSVVLRGASILKTASLVDSSRSNSVSLNPDENSRTSNAGCNYTASPKVESIYLSPADSHHITQTSSSAEDLYSEPFMPTPSKEVCGIPMKSKQVVKVASRKKRGHEYDEIEEVRSDFIELESNDNDDNSSDDDSIANMLAIRESVCRVSQFCVDGGSVRQQLETQAQRLSARFSCMIDKKTSLAGVGNKIGLGQNGHLATVEESLLSPSTEEPFGLFSSGPGLCSQPDWSVTTPSILGALDSNLPTNTPDLLRSSSAPHDMRRYIVTTLLDSECSYLQTLDFLLQWWKESGSALSLPDVETVFALIQQLRDAHSQFYNELKPVTDNWEPGNSIGSTLKILATHEYAVAPNYLQNYQQAIIAISKYQQDNPAFDETFKAQQAGEKSSLEDLLRKPVIRFERNTLVLHDLIKYTPTAHDDYDLLQKTLKLARHFLDNLVSPTADNANKFENQRYLVKHGLIVEKLTKERKLRHVFLFNDVIVAAKQKVAGRQKEQYDVKWFIPLTDLSIEDKILSQEDMRATEDHKQEVEMLQRKVSELQAEYKFELKKTKDVSDATKPRLLRRNKSLEKMRKKLMEQEVYLVIAMPHMSFRINNRKQRKQYVLMMSSDYERSDWTDAIAGLLHKAFQSAQSVPTLTDVQNLLGKNRAVGLKQTGTALDRDSLFIEEERMYGCLHVLVTKLHGLKQPARAFCRIEVDSFGHFLTKAKTNIVGPNQEPTWAEEFEVDLDGAQTLRVMCYSQDKGIDVLLGKGAIELSGMWLKDDFHEQAISMNNELTLMISLKHLSHEQTIRRCASVTGALLFGARLDAITRREGNSIPQILTKCIQEIESRGLDEEGLYRISGLSTHVDELKDAFEKNVPNIINRKLKEADIHVVTNIVKLFFRSFPDPLFTEQLYPSFSEGIGLADPDAKDRRLKTLVCSLPSPNFATAMLLIDHLIRVSKHELRNKMNLRNLAVVFGPTVIRSANRCSQPKTTEQLFYLATHEITVQTTVLHHILVMRSTGTQFERSKIVSSLSVTS